MAKDPQAKLERMRQRKEARRVARNEGHAQKEKGSGVSATCMTTTSGKSSSPRARL